MKKITCEWPTTPLYQAYHDHEWGDQFMMIGFNLNIFVLKASNVALAGLLF